jgi:hypothetical protein
MGLIDECRPGRITDTDCSGQKHVPSSRGVRCRSRKEVVTSSRSSAVGRAVSVSIVNAAGTGDSTTQVTRQ